MKLTIGFLIIAVFLIGILIRGINLMVLEGHNKRGPTGSTLGSKSENVEDLRECKNC